jgi:hypothetical protein
MRCSMKWAPLTTAVLSLTLLLSAGCEHTPTGAGSVAANHFRVQVDGSASGSYEGQVYGDTASAIPAGTIDLTTYDPPSPRELRIYRPNFDTAPFAVGRYAVKKDVYVTYVVGYGGVGDPNYGVFQGTGGVLQVTTATPDHFVATLDAVVERTGGLQNRVRATIDITRP